MALDQAYFDGIHIDVVKKKYYNANKVEAVFADIRRQAAEMEEENARLRQALAIQEGRKSEIGGAVLSAQTLYREITERANTRAQAVEQGAARHAAELLEAARQQAREILEAARRESEQMLQESRRRQEYAVIRTEELMARLRQREQENLELLSSSWQAFLCSLYPEESGAASPAGAPAEPVIPPEKAEDPEEKLRRDMGRQLDRIAKDMFSLDEPEANE